MLPKGTLIRVKDRQLKMDGKHNDGPLWVVKDTRLHDDGTGAAYTCKSLATGERWTWFTDEFDIADEEQE